MARSRRLDASPPARRRQQLTAIRSTATCSTRSARRTSSTCPTRSTRRSPTPRAVGHDHRRRRPAQPLDQRRDGHRGQLGHGQRELHGLAVGAERPDGQRRLRDAPTARRPPGDYTATGGNLVFNPGETTRTADGPDHERHARRDRRDVLRRTWPIRSTRRSWTARASARSPTTTTPPTISINDVTVDRGQRGTANAIFTVTPLRRERADGHGRLRDGQRHGDRAGATTWRRRCRR